MKKEEYIIRIHTGDPGYGHGESDDWYFKLNYSMEFIKEAYNKSSELTGVDFVKECDESNDNELSEECINSLSEHGIETLDFTGLEKNIGAEDFAFLIMKFISLSMPEDFVYSKYNNNIQSLGTFGYGLY